jgi:hypothetical protein
VKRYYLLYIVAGVIGAWIGWAGRGKPIGCGTVVRVAISSPLLAPSYSDAIVRLEDGRIITAEGSPLISAGDPACLSRHFGNDFVSQWAMKDGGR